MFSESGSGVVPDCFSQLTVSVDLGSSELKIWEERRETVKVSSDPAGIS